ncbi:protein kinase [Myxococcota bacterium]
MSDSPTITGSGRYELLRRIGVGGMGEVFLAHDTILDRKVVIKHLRAELSSDRKFVGMFLDEARAVARCEHPNIVRIFDIDIESERYFMALEWLEGWDLERIVRQTTATGNLLPVPVIVSWMIAACRGLQAAHEAVTADGRALNLVHRDISPANLFVTSDGVLKILDFGVAKTAVQRRHTLIGSIRGKIAYMSPEQRRCDPLDRRSDIYSLGVVFHELLTGERLFPPQSADAHVIAQAGVLPPARDPEPLPEAIVRIAMRALNKNPALRYPSAQHLVDVLRAASREIGGPADDDQAAQLLTRLFPDGPAATDQVGDQLEPTDHRHMGTPIAEGTPAIGLLDPTVEVDDVAKPDRNGVHQPATVNLSPISSPPTRKLRARLLVIASPALVALIIAATWAWYTVDRNGVKPPLQKPSQSNAPSAAPSPDPKEATPDPPQKPAKIDTSQRKTAAKTTRKGKASARTAQGRLTLQSFPWANVYIDGKLIGPTPIYNHPLPAKTFKIRLFNPEEKLEAVETIRIQPGKTTKRRIELKPRGA